MRLFYLFIFTLLTTQAFTQVVLNADGPGNTYNLITSVLAPGHNPIETPDCAHAPFGDHIDEVFDNELNTNVFRFHIHTTSDDDRCINFDRQRNEIKSYDKSPDNLLGIDGEEVIYRWKFKLDAGFQSSPNFTHLHQLKSVGGDLASMPMYTLTARKNNPDRLELRYAETNQQVTLTQIDIAPLLGTWVEVIETITYGTEGTYHIEINRLSDSATLMEYSNESIINWRPGAEFVRPKWGIYRSLINAQDLRDEIVLFADISVEEKISTPVFSIDDGALQITFTNPASQILTIENLSDNVDIVAIYGLDGRRILSQRTDSRNAVTLDVSSVPNGAYILSLQGSRIHQSELIFIAN